MLRKLCSNVMWLKITIVVFLLVPGFSMEARAIGVSSPSVNRDVLLSLPELEHLVGNGPEALASLAALARDNRLVQAEADRLSPRLFAGLVYGYNDEPVTETSSERYSYSKLSGTVGVSFPLLGTWTRQKIDRIRADISRSESQYRSELVRRNNVIALRKAYSVLWSEQRRRPILNTFLSDESYVMDILNERLRENLILESDLLEFASAYDTVRRDIVISKLNVSRSLGTIAAATGRRWILPARIDPPELPGIRELALNLKSQPDLAGSEEAARLYEEILKLSRNTERDGNLDVGLVGTRDFPGTWGTGAYVGISIKEPWGSLTSKVDHRREAASADLERAQWEAVNARVRLENNFEEQLLWNDYARDSVRTGTTRLAGAQKNVEERTLRYQALPGDTFEQLLRSRYAMLRVAMDMIDAEALTLQTYIELLAMTSDSAQGAGDSMRMFPLTDTNYRDGLLRFGPMPPFPLKPQVAGGTKAQENAPRTAITRKNMPIIDETMLPALIAVPEDFAGQIPVFTEKTEAIEKKSRSRAVYVWNAGPFLSADSRGKALERLMANEFDRILLSFTAGEIRNLRTPGGAARLQAFLDAASEKNISVDLLLGDPAWITPVARGELEDLLKFFSAWPFSGVHLDLEPDMLPGAEQKRDVLLGELLDTLKMATTVAGRPVGISIHPRYLEGVPGRRATSAFSRMGLAEVAVMIYSTDAEAVAERFSKICRSAPTLHFSLAQSVESVLPRTESYFSAGEAIFGRRMQTLLSAVKNANFRSLIIQSWEYYTLMEQ